MRTLKARLDRLEPVTVQPEYTEAEIEAIRAKLLARLNYVCEHEPESAERVFAAVERHMPDWRERIARIEADRQDGRWAARS